MGTRLSGRERRNAMKFLKAFVLLICNVMVLLVLLPREWFRTTFLRSRQPVPVRR